MQKQGSSAALLGKPSSTTSAGAGAGAGADVFGSLWSTASHKAGIANKSGNPGAGSGVNQGTDLASLARRKNEEALWGTGSSTTGSGSGSGSKQQQQQQQQSGMLGGGLDDLLG